MCVSCNRDAAMVGGENLGSVSSFTDMIQSYVTKDIQSKLFHFTPGHFSVLIGEYMKLNSVANSRGSL